MPKISPQAFRDRRANIMNAARRCFARDGIHISVDEICAEAGISKGALYGYFDTKEAIIQAIADEHVTDLSAVREARSQEELVSALAERLSDGEPAANRLEIEAWAYAFNRDELRNRLLANAIELQSAIRMALPRIIRVEDQNVPDIAVILETFSLGLVAKAALGQKEDVRGSLTAILGMLNCYGNASGGTA